MNYLHDLQQYAEIKRYEYEYEQLGLPWQKSLIDAVVQATEGTGEPDMDLVKRRVIKILQAGIETCLAKKIKDSANNPGWNPAKMLGCAVNFVLTVFGKKK